MRQVILQPFYESSPLKKKLLLVMLLTQTLLGSTISCIPMLFYRPKFFCTNPVTQELYHCDESQACREPTLHYQSEYSFSSIPLDYKLYCSRKITEVNMTTAMLFGHVIGAAIAIYLSKFSNVRTNVLWIVMIGNLLSGVSMFLVFLFNNIYVIGVLLTTWGALMEIIYGLNIIVPNLMYPHKIIKRVMSLLISAWSILAIFMPTLFYIFKSWRIYLLVAVGLPHLFIAYFFYANFETLQNINIEDSPLNEYSQALEIKERQSRMTVKTHYEEIIEIGDLYRSSHWRNFLLYLVVYGGASLAAGTSVLTLNTLSGNIYFNLTVINFVELVICILGSYIGHFFNVKRALLFTFSMMAVGYLTYSFLPNFLQYYVVLQGKLFTDFLWTLLGIYLYQIMPKKFMSLVLTTKSLSSVMILCSVPYIKYGMQLIGLTIFPFSGLYELTSVLCLKAPIPSTAEFQEIDVSLID